ncbi:energy transducer TonB [Hymenobacter sediminicola]|uniref:Energy transducer TonB n=1 Tax=Hymenobacter sediminicola TaxID=2761579 RepID=A0A7G7W813_9BACT|nr:energy transducer TonB [Hymenobacter sediminicola]QNH62506.1 energy transducer TonB [Hymenobacter sediminicola]
MKVLLLLPLFALPVFFGQTAAAQHPFQTAFIADADTVGLSSKPATVGMAGATVANHCFPIRQELPCFKQGGSAGLQQFFIQHLQYPRLFLRSYNEGITTVRFIIDTQGMIRNPTTQKSFVLAWDEEVIRVVKLLNGHFKPATYNGQPLDAYVTLAIPLAIL